VIPLFYILPTDNLYTKTTGVVTKITPSFVQSSRVLQLEFMYNLEEFFYLTIEFSSFDQPSSIQLSGLYGTQSIPVTEGQQTYSLTGKKVSVIIQKDDILSIANNAISVSDMQSNIEIEIKTLRDNKDISGRPRVTSFELNDLAILMQVNGSSLSYRNGRRKENYQPVVSVNGVESVPSAIDGHYSIFHLSGDLSGLSLAILPLQDFRNHFLFRQDPALKNCIVEHSIFKARQKTYQFQNGAIRVQNNLMTMQYFFQKEKDDFRQYIFNATRDENIYSEISLLIPAVKHDSMTVYDLKKDVLIFGRKVMETIVSADGTVHHRLTLLECADMFGRSIEDIFIFDYLPHFIHGKDWKQSDGSEGLGHLLRKTGLTEEYIPTSSAKPKYKNKDYLSLSNTRYVATVFKKTLYSFTKSHPATDSQLKRIAPGNFISPRESFVSIDNSSVSFSHGSYAQSYSRENSPILAENSLLSEHKDITTFAGVVFNANPKIITTAQINITNRDTYLLLCRSIETAEYGVIGVRRGTRQLTYSISFLFDDTTITCIANIEQRKIYYINYQTKQVETDPSEFSGTFKKYLSSVDEENLMSFIVKGTTGGSKLNIFPFVAQVEKKKSLYASMLSRELVLDPNNALMPMLLNRDLSRIVIGDSSERTVLKSRFGTSSGIFKQISSGIFCTESVQITMISVVDSSFEFKAIFEGEEFGFIFEFDGGHTEFLLDFKRSVFNKNDFSHGPATSFDVLADQAYEKVFQYFNFRVFQNTFEPSFAIDIPILMKAVKSGQIGVLGTCFVQADEQFIFDSTGFHEVLFTDGQISSINGEEAEIVEEGKAILLVDALAGNSLVSSICSSKSVTLKDAYPDEEQLYARECTLNQNYAIISDIDIGQYREIREQ